MEIRRELFKIYHLLETSLSLAEGWPGGRWPVSGGFKPPEFEIVVGAILSQNTNWKNVEKALRRLSIGGIKDAQSILSCPQSTLENAIRPAGFYRKKSIVLKHTAKTILEVGKHFYSVVTRERLISINGIGPETADAILLYACLQPEFVADAYARRILGRYGLLVEEGYSEAKQFFEAHLSAHVKFYQLFHALLVEHAKECCRKVPLCPKCVLQEDCQMTGLT
ncbi:MAG: endonuclease [bacterium]